MENTVHTRHYYTWQVIKSDDGVTDCFPLFCSPKVAIIAGNFELAEFIKNHKDDSIGKSEQLTFFNENCRSAHNLSLAFHVRASTWWNEI